MQLSRFLLSSERVGSATIARSARCTLSSGTPPPPAGLIAWGLPRIMEASERTKNLVCRGFHQREPPPVFICVKPATIPQTLDPRPHPSTPSPPLPLQMETRINCPLSEMQTFWYRRLLLKESSFLSEMEGVVSVWGGRGGGRVSALGGGQCGDGGLQDTLPGENPAVWTV